MSIVLADALKELALKPGETRSIPVDDYEIVIRRPLVVDDPGPMVSICLNVPPSENARTIRLVRGEPDFPKPIEITESDLARGMIYSICNADDPLDQGDILDDCPMVTAAEHAPDRLEEARLDLRLGIILTQTCDIAQTKVDRFVVAAVFSAQDLIDRKVVKAADVKGPIRAGRVWGVYFLPSHAPAGLGEMIVDFQRLHSIPVKVLDTLRQAGKRRIRLLTPYREHLAKHFADTYSRIGLPQPYETL